MSSVASLFVQSIYRFYSSNGPDKAHLQYTHKSNPIKGKSRMEVQKDEPLPLLFSKGQQKTHVPGKIHLWIYIRATF